MVVSMSLIVVGTFQQQHVLSELRSRKNRVQRQASQIIARLDHPEGLKKRIEVQDARANLIAFLGNRVSPTRLVTCISNALPQYVSITEYRSDFETRVLQDRGQIRGRRKPKQNETKSGLPQQIDFKRLLTESPKNILVVSVNGIAPDDVAISKYLAALEETGFFKQITLLFTDEYIEQEQSLRSFSLRLEVRKLRPMESTEDVGITAERRSSREGGQS